jgi:hypothetical protein
MRSIKILAVLGIALLMSGCVLSSLHPLFTEKDLVFDKSLLGTWTGAGEDDTLTFEDGGEKAYDLTYSAEGPKVRYKAHLVQLGKYRFLDIYPQESEDYDAYHFIPAHTFWKIWMEEDNLHIDGLAHDWLKNMIDQKKIKIPHEVLEDRILLTATTKELQEFVLKYAEDASAFSVTEEFHRQK